MSRKFRQWTRDEFVEARQAIKDELLRLMEAEPSATRGEVALRRIAQSQEDLTSQGMMKTFVCIMIALQEHSQNAILGERDVRQLIDLAHKILKLSNVKPIESNLAFLYGDLHLALSQIQRADGRQTESAWEQLMSSYLGGRDSSRGENHFTLAAGFRAMRLGYGSMAINRLQEVLNSTAADDGQRRRAALALLICARMRGDSKMRDQVKAIVQTMPLDPDETREIAWEDICWRTQQTLNLDEMITAVLRSGTHHQSTYEIEAQLWAWTAKERKWQNRLPKIRSIIGRPSQDSLKRNAFFGWAKRFEELLDSTTPYTERLRTAGELLSSSEKIISVDKQILALACLARWLSRNRSYEFAALVLGRIELLSIGLSSGAIRDTSGLISDLLSESWFTGARENIPTEHVA